MNTGLQEKYSLVANVAFSERLVNMEGLKGRIKLSGGCTTWHSNLGAYLGLQAHTFGHHYDYT